MGFLGAVTRGEFWFDDGSVILVLQQRVAFFVHKSILSAHSDVFADLFTVPQPPTPSPPPRITPQEGQELETIALPNNHSVVHLPDSVDDFLDVLRALYRPLYFDNLSSDADLSTLIDFLSGILRISTKYNITILRQKCISILKTKFPSTLQGCDALVASGYKYSSSTIVRAIPLARETNVPEILPWAFYIAANIVKEALLEDPVLSWRDKTLCLAGKDHLWELQKTCSHRFLFEIAGSKAVECRSGCVSRLPQSMTWRRCEELRTAPHPLHEFDEWDSLKVCAQCLEQTKWAHQVGRERVWESLPGIFHLGSWEDIRLEQNR